MCRQLIPCHSVVYGRSQAATLWSLLCGPSLNFTPWTTWAKRACPFSARHSCSAVFSQLEDHRQHPGTRDATTRLGRAQPHRTEHWQHIRTTKLIESTFFIATGSGKRLVCCGATFGHRDLIELGLGFSLQALGRDEPVDPIHSFDSSDHRLKPGVNENSRCP
jgi:hypothetical protein